MPESFGSSDDFSDSSHSYEVEHYSLQGDEYGRIESPTDSISDDPNSNEFLGFPDLSLNGAIPFKKYEIPSKLPRPKEFYKKELEEIAELLEKKFKHSTPHELEFVNSGEAQSLFLAGLQLFQEIKQYNVTINSDTFRAWVLIQRWSGRMQRPEVLYDQIKELGIHRPSFRLCASILTSYANGSYQLAKREYVECAIKSLKMMKMHNYVPNTYVYNALFVMCNKNHLYREVWKFFIELMVNSGPTQSNLDGFTCASLMETCVAEQNPHKGKAIYELFKMLPNSLKKNNEKYIAQLKSKLDEIYEEQSHAYDSWNNSQHFNEKMDSNKLTQNHETGPQNYSSNSFNAFQDNISNPLNQWNSFQNVFRSDDPHAISSGLFDSFTFTH